MASPQLFHALFFYIIFIIIAPKFISGHNFHIPKTSTFQSLKGSRKGDSVEGINGLKAYLQHFGYLSRQNQSHSHVVVHNNTFDDALESAIKKYQRYYKLEVDGVLNSETLALLSTPRCGVPDIINGENSLYESHYTFFPRIPPLRWPRSKMHLTYLLNSHRFPLEDIVAKEGVDKAFSMWTSVSKFTFSKASDLNPDIKMSFERLDHGDGYPFDGKGGTVGHAFGPNDGRVHFDADELWSNDVVPKMYNVESVALHEIGHVLGLAHSLDQHAIMYAYMKEGEFRTINEDDIYGIQALYKNY